MRVSVLGMGNMGQAFAGRALDRGHDVTIWNRTAGKAAELVERGAVQAESVADAVAGAEVSLLSVADDAAVRDICLTRSGLASIADGAVLANVSTVSPALARELAAAGPADAVLDSPIMGAPSVVARGGGYFLVGGPAAVVERLAPLWGDLGAGYAHCGPAGSGAVLKLMSNLQLVIGVTALAEAVATARRHGIDDELLRTVFSESMVVSQTSRMRLNALLDEGHQGWFTPGLARKDVGLAIGLAEQEGVPVRLGPATDELLKKAESLGDWADFSAVIEALNHTG